MAFRKIATLLAVLVPAAMMTPAFGGSTGDGLILRGAGIVEANCARCHAVGPVGESKHTDAPPFRVVVTRYAPETLAEALGEGISTGHPDMPVFTFEPEEIAAIIAYLETLGGPAAGADGP